MPCLSPTPGHRTGKGDKAAVELLDTLAQARTVAFQSAGQYLEIPCGHCESCRAKNSRDWAIRAHHESLLHTRIVNGQHIINGCFITLTYNDPHLPVGNTLVKQHWVRFLKKLRNRTSGPIRFLQCGEYGSNGTKRPHYHATLFGIDFHEDRYVWKKDADGIQWRSPKLERCWSDDDGPIGHCTLSPLNFATTKYVAGYVFKKLKYNAHLDDRSVWAWQEHEELHDENGPVTRLVRTGPIPEYINMSRSNGLGHDWLMGNEKHAAHVHQVYPRDIVHVNGKTYRPPAYYDKLLEKHHNDLWLEVKEKRELHIEGIEPTTELQLSARNAIFRAKNRNHHKRDKIQ